MTRRAMTKPGRGTSATGATATGASATGASSVGAMAFAAMAMGALAVGALAVGRLTVGRAKLRRVEIGELTVGRIEVGEDAPSGRTLAVAQVRAAAGMGDAVERLLRDHAEASLAGGLRYRAHRSENDPDLFLFSGSSSDGADGDTPPPFGAIVRLAAERGLLAATDEPGGVERYRTL